MTVYTRVYVTEFISTRQVPKELQPKVLMGKLVTIVVFYYGSFQTDYTGSVVTLFSPY